MPTKKLLPFSANIYPTVEHKVTVIEQVGKIFVNKSKRIIFAYE